MPTQEELVNWLRDALGYLYDTHYLRQSPLLDLLVPADSPEPVSALRDQLTAAVASLKPAHHVPVNTRDWRLYDALFYAYVQQLDQRIVADQLALSVRQLRREQRVALEILAERLQAAAEEAADAPVAAEEKAGPDFNKELAWLKDLPPEQPTDLEAALAETLDLIQPLAVQNHTHIEVMGFENLPYLSVHPVALNQILLNLLNIAITRTRNSSVNIRAQALPWDVEIRIQQESAVIEEPATVDDETTSLNIAKQLVSICNGTLTSSNDERFEVRVMLPALNQLVVLAIDDNTDTLQLLERYTVGTRYRLVGTPSPEQALSLAEVHHPQLIILDVMMPQIDGLKMMGMLRQHPLTQHIPIIVCTILPQEKLVLSLGASGFLRKPFTRQALLKTLNQQLAAQRPAPVPPLPETPPLETESR